MRILVMITMLGFLISCKQNSIVSDPLASEYPLGAVRQSYEGIPGLERVYTLGDNGLRYEGDYFNGKKHGSWTEYYNNGFINKVTTYFNGIKQGLYLEFNDRGEIQMKAYLHNGVYEGEVLEFNRAKIRERRTYSGGKLNGLKRTFYINGNPQEESNYVDGKMDGEAKYYDTEGQLLFIYEYKDGQLVKKD